jgi:hypothetical protein
MTPIVLKDHESLKSYHYIGEEMESLGHRLDHAKIALKRSKRKWAKMYWKSVVDRLTIQWKHLPVLRDGNAQATNRPRWTIDYDFFEPDDGIGRLDLGTQVLRDMIAKPNFDYTWNRNIERRLAKAQ